MKRRKNGNKQYFTKMGTRKTVQAFVRVKPTDYFAHEMIKYGDDNKSIDIHLKKDAQRGVVNNQQTDWSFKLDGVLHDASQDLVYETVAKDAVSQALDGYNGTIMCYGQTGAGKTYTMTGATENYKHRGILPRALQQVFRMIEERPIHAITVRVSYLEIYNENLFDLLSTLPYVGPSVTPMTIVENPQGVFIKGLSVHLTSQEEDALSLLFEGETNRIIASHTLNKNSSRSHCIFTIYMEAHSRTLSDGKYITSKINLVDLAGSERLGKTGRMVKHLEKELALLKQELALHDSLIINLRQIQEVFNQFRVVLSQQEREVESALRRKYTLIDKNDFEAISAVQKAGLMDAEGHLVGEPDGQSFGLGVAPFSTKHGKKPKSKKTLKEQPSSSARKEGTSSPGSGRDLEVISISKTQLVSSSKEGDGKDMLPRDQETSSTEPLASDSPKEESCPPRPSTPPSKPVAFELFKNERGSEINRIFKENKSILNERRKRASETTQHINAIKHDIDVTKEALNFQKSLREKQGEYENKGLMIIDEEEFLLILKLKDLKQQYRNEYQELRDLRAEIQYCQRLVDQCRQRLLMEFDIWYNESFVIPEDMQVALKVGSSIRPGMVPANRIVSLGEDDQDRFIQLQQTVLPEGPDSISYYNAKVKTEQKHNYMKTMVGLQQAHRK